VRRPHRSIQLNLRRLERRQLHARARASRRGGNIPTVLDIGIERREERIECVREPSSLVSPNVTASGTSGNRTRNVPLVSLVRVTGYRIVASSAAAAVIRGHQ
jgi:hypothetical protein